MHLYPLKFRPILKEKIWGGSKIRSLLNRIESNTGLIGETWELSTINGEESIISNGALKGHSLKDVINLAPDEILGEDVLRIYGNDFPLLIKYIDAKQDLSVQVHPHDELAKSKHDSKGKTESWYIMQSDEQSKIFHGLKEGVSREDFVNAISDGSTIDLVNEKDVKKGDFFHIPAGTVHTIGKGNLILEIQQASDITYRIFDFNRQDDNGNKRELHIKDALEAISFDKGPKNLDESFNSDELTDNPYYKVSKQYIENDSVDYIGDEGLKVLISVNGKGFIKSNNEEILTINYSDVVLIPAGLKQYTISSKEQMELLIVTLN